MGPRRRAGDRERRCSPPWSAGTTWPDGSRRRGRPRPARPLRRARPVGWRRRDGPGTGVRAGRAGRVRRSPRGVPRTAQRLGERDLPGPRPRGRAFGAARAPPRLPHRDGDRVRASLDGRAARGGRGAHAPGAAGLRRAAGRHGARARRRGGTALRALRVPPRLGTGLGVRLGIRRGSGADPQPFRRTGRDHRADAPARAGMVAPGLVHPVPLGLRGGLRPSGPVGPLAGRHRRRAVRTCRSSPGWTTCSRPG